MNFFRLWLTVASDPAYGLIAHDVGVTAMCWVKGVRSPQLMIWTDAARRHGIISAQGPRRNVHRNSTKGCHTQKISPKLFGIWVAMFKYCYSPCYYKFQIN